MANFLSRHNASWTERSGFATSYSIIILIGEFDNCSIFAFILQSTNQSPGVDYIRWNIYTCWATFRPHLALVELPSTSERIVMDCTYKGVYIVACQAHPVLVFLLRSLTDKLYFLLSIVHLFNGLKG